MLLGLVEHGDCGTGELPERLLQNLGLAIPAAGAILKFVKSLCDGVDRVDLFSHHNAPADSRLMLLNNITLH